MEVLLVLFKFGMRLLAQRLGDWSGLGRVAGVGRGRGHLLIAIGECDKRHIAERDAIIGAAVHDGAPVHDDAKIVRRADGSYLLDGALKIEDLRDLLELGALPGEDEHDYQTLAGMLIAVLGHIPQVAETYDFDGYRFEVVDLDGARVDKVLVAAIDRKAPELA